MATDRELAVKGIANLISMSPTIGDGNEAAKAMQRRTVKIIKLSADPAAGDATTNGVANATFTTQVSLFRKSKLVDARIIPQSNTAVAANASNFATINVTQDNGGGGAQTVILTNTTKPTANGGVGNIPALSAGTYVSLTSSIVANAAECPAGSYLQLQVAKAASGVALQPFVLELDFEEI